jgi:O-antigen/teichoic acid export membrane protein
MSLWGHSKSVNARFFMTLIVNVAKTVLGFVTGVIIARKLGPADYGDFNFLLASFTSIATLIDMGSSSAFYTFLSQKKREKVFYLYYLLWLAVQFVLISLLISVIFPEPWRKAVWLGHTKGVVLLAFMASFMMTKIWPTVSQIGESIRETIIVQKYSLFLTIAYLLIVGVLAGTQTININKLFGVTIILHLLFSLLLARRLKKDLVDAERGDSKEVLKDFVDYCKPLVIYGAAGFIYTFADTWLLQKFGGSVEQGFYSIALKFSTICLSVTSSILSVFWKEAAEAHKKNDKERLYKLFTKTSQSVFFVGAFMACFLIPFSRDLIRLFLGTAYEATWPSLAIMFLYPVYGSLGQISGSYFYSISETKLYSTIGIIGQCLSVPFTYLFLAPTSAAIPGLGLGSIGLSIKTVLYTLIMVNVLIYFIFKISKWPRNFFYQPQIIILLLLISLASRWLSTAIFGQRNFLYPDLIIMAMSGIFYCVLAGGLVYVVPRYAGLARQELSSFVSVIKQKYKNLF